MTARGQRSGYHEPARLGVVVIGTAVTEAAQRRVRPPVDVVSGEPSATAESARNSVGWIFRPLFCARRRMPRAARADSQYLAGEVGSSTSVSVNSTDEHTPSALRHSEETAVENPPSHAVPEVGQRSKHDSEVPTAVAREETKNVLEENGSGSNSLDESAGVEEQTGSPAGEPGPPSGDGHVLAREPSDEEIRNGDCVNPPGSVRDGDTSISRSSRRWFDTKRRHVLEDGDAGEPVGEDGAAVDALRPLFLFFLGSVGISASFALQHDAATGSLDSEVESTDA